MKPNKYSLFTLLSIVILSFTMHAPHFNKELISIHVWRQTQTQTTITNFYEEDFNILNPKRNHRKNTDGIFRMEFPLMQWLIAGVYKITNPSILVTRICMWIFGLLATFALFLLLKSLTNNLPAALIGAWFFTFSPSFFYFTINPLPDIFALALGLFGLSFFVDYYKNQKVSTLVISSIFLSLATLVKLPFAVFYSLPFFYLIQTKPLRIKAVLLLLAPFIFPLAWYSWVIPTWKGNGIVQGILDSKVSLAIYLDYLQHNLISTLPESIIGYAALLCFLAGIWVLIKKASTKNALHASFLGWTTMLAVYLLFELNMIAKVHDYYLFPFYPLLFVAIAVGSSYFFNHKKLKLLLIIAIVVAPFTCYLRLKDRWNLDKPGFNKDFLTYKTQLRGAVPNSDLVIVGNDISQFILFYYINKKGWNFDSDQLNSQQLKEYIQSGAKYLYTDSEEIQQKIELQPYFKAVKAEFGSIQIIELQAFN